MTTVVCCVHCGHTKVRDGDMRTARQVMRKAGWHVDSLGMFRCPRCWARAEAAMNDLEVTKGA